MCPSNQSIQTMVSIDGKMMDNPSKIDVTNTSKEYTEGNMKDGKRILVTNIRVSHSVAQAPQVDGKVITCHEQAAI